MLSRMIDLQNIVENGQIEVMYRPNRTAWFWGLIDTDTDAFYPSRIPYKYEACAIDAARVFASEDSTYEYNQAIIWRKVTSEGSGGIYAKPLLPERHDNDNSFLWVRPQMVSPDGPLRYEPTVGFDDVPAHVVLDSYEIGERAIEACVEWHNRQIEKANGGKG